MVLPFEAPGETAETFTYTINWGDGTPVETFNGNPGTVTHTYPDGPKTHQITATATDEHGSYTVSTLATTNPIDTTFGTNGVTRLDIAVDTNGDTVPEHTAVTSGGAMNRPKKTNTFARRMPQTATPRRVSRAGSRSGSPHSGWSR